MARHLRILTELSIFLVLASPLQARRICGGVSMQGHPAPGIIVTDGVHFTMTDAKGEFSLTVAPGSRFVHIVSPAGYSAPYSSGTTEFYMPIEGTKNFKWDLEPLAGKHDGYNLIAVSDPQMRDDKHLEQFRQKPLPDLAFTVESLVEKHPTIAVALGDIAENRLGMFTQYKEAMSSLGIPCYAVIGNHDYIQNEDEPEARKDFEDAFGPTNWACWLGEGTLLIGLDNILFKASGSNDSDKTSARYTEGYSPEVLAFVSGLMAKVPEDAFVYIVQHSPVHYHGRRIEASAELLSLLGERRVEFVSGHTHSMASLVLSNTAHDRNIGAISGTWWGSDWVYDGEPRGYEILSYDPVRGRTARWHNVDYDEDFQVEWLGHTERHPYDLVANVWDYSPGWSIRWREDGGEWSEAARVVDVSPSYRKHTPMGTAPMPNNHYFLASPSIYAKKVDMEVSVQDGRRWFHTFEIDSGK